MAARIERMTQSGFVQWALEKALGWVGEDEE
jgi:hypothetical protein